MESIYKQFYTRMWLLGRNENEDMQSIDTLFQLCDEAASLMATLHVFALRAAGGDGAKAAVHVSKNYIGVAMKTTNLYEDAGFVLPTSTLLESIDALVEKGDEILTVGCGRGLLDFALRLQKKRVISTDIGDSKTGDSVLPPRVHDREPLSAEDAASMHVHHCALLLITAPHEAAWPQYKAAVDIFLAAGKRVVLVVNFAACLHLVEAEFAHAIVSKTRCASVMSIVDWLIVLHCKK